MQLMRVKDVFVSEDGFLILTGSLILANIREQSEIKKLFGATIEIKNPNGGITIASIKDIAVS